MAMKTGLAQLTLPPGGDENGSIDYAPRWVRASADAEAK